MYKKIFMGIAAVAALTLVSCSSDDLNSLSDNFQFLSLCDSSAKG